MKLQVTLFDKNKKYKPMSTIVEIESMEYYEQNKGEVQKRALLNIAHQRRTLPQDIMKQGFTQIKVREYNIEKIKEQQEYKHRLNLIKKIAREREEKRTRKKNRNISICSRRLRLTDSYDVRHERSWIPY